MTLAPTSTATVTGQDAFNLVQQQFPALAWMLQIPDLAGTITNLAAQGITDQNEIQAAVEQTNWWQTTAQTARSFLQLEITDPAEAQRQVSQQEAALAQTFSQMGLNPTPAQLNSFSYQSLLNGWSTAQIQQNVAQSIQPNADGSFSIGINIQALPSVNSNDYALAFAQVPQGAVLLGTIGQGGVINGSDVTGGAPTYAEMPDGSLRQGFDRNSLPPGTKIYTLAEFAPNVVKPGANNPVGQRPGGQLQVTEQQLTQLAKQFMVNVSPQAISQWTAQIAGGQTTPEAFQAYLQGTAESQFPWMAQGIKEGQTPLQIVNPYANMAANELGISPDSIDWTQPQWSKLLSTSDPKTGALAQVPIWQATQTLRSDPTYGWQKTPQAKDAAYSFVQGLQETMGLRSYGGSSPGSIPTPASFGSSGG